MEDFKVQDISEEEEQPYVVVVIINWEVYKETIACIDSLKKIVYDNFHVLVIDNGSKNESVSVIEQFITNESRFSLHQTGENLGFSGGANYGLNKALEMNAQYTWLLNNDTEVAPDCLLELVLEMMRDSKAGIAGSKIMLFSHRDIIWHAGATFDKFTGQPKHLGIGCDASSSIYNELKYVDYVTGCSFLIRNSLINEIGLMDDNFYLYYEEADLCFRARQKGWNILYVPSSVLWHKVAASTSSYSQRVYYEVRNRLLFTKKHRPQFLMFVIFFLIYKEILLNLIKKDPLASHLSLIGFIDFFKAKFGKINRNL